MAKATESTAMQIVNGILSHGIDGIGPMSSSKELASEYRKDSSYENMEQRVDSLINWETSKNFGSGFLTGLGGLLILPVTVPASLYSSWVVQGRMAGAIAELYGHSVDDDRVRTFVLLSLIGDSVKEVMKSSGVQIGQKVVLNAIQQIPGRVLIEINKKVGFRLLTKAGEKGIINLTKIVPVVGGLVGGTVDAVTCKAVGSAAKNIFRR